MLFKKGNRRFSGLGRNSRFSRDASSAICLRGEVVVRCLTDVLLPLRRLFAHGLARLFRAIDPGSVDVKNEKESACLRRNRNRFVDGAVVRRSCGSNFIAVHLAGIMQD